MTTNPHNTKPIAGYCVFGTAKGFSSEGYGALDIKQNLAGRLFDRIGEDNKLITHEDEAIYFRFPRKSRDGYLDIVGKIQNASDTRGRGGILGAAIALNHNGKPSEENFSLAVMWLDGQIKHIEDEALIDNQFNRDDFSGLLEEPDEEHLYYRGSPLVGKERQRLTRVGYDKEVAFLPARPSLLLYLSTVDNYAPHGTVISNYNYPNSKHQITSANLDDYAEKIAEQKRQEDIRKGLSDLRASQGQIQNLHYDLESAHREQDRSRGKIKEWEGKLNASKRYALDIGDKIDKAVERESNIRAELKAHNYGPIPPTYEHAGTATPPSAPTSPTEYISMGEDHASPEEIAIAAANRRPDKPQRMSPRPGELQGRASSPQSSGMHTDTRHGKATPAPAQQPKTTSQTEMRREKAPFDLFFWIRNKSRSPTLSAVEKEALRNRGDDELVERSEQQEDRGVPNIIRYLVIAIVAIVVGTIISITIDSYSTGGSKFYGGLRPPELAQGHANNQACEDLRSDFNQLASNVNRNDNYSNENNEKRKILNAVAQPFSRNRDELVDLYFLCADAGRTEMQGCPIVSKRMRRSGFPPTDNKNTQIALTNYIHCILYENDEY